MIIVLIIFLLLFIHPSTVFANIGLPMIGIYLPSAWSALIPVILIEGFIGTRSLGVSLKRTILASTLANSFSTIIGLPLTWFILAIVEGLFFGTARGLNTFAARIYAVTVQAPWLIPYETHFWWMIPVATIVLAVPFYAMSVYTEFMIVQRILRETPRRKVWIWMLKANICSYLLLLMIVGAGLKWSPIERISKFLFPVVEWIVEGVFCVARLAR